MIDFFYGIGLLVALANFSILANAKNIFNITEWLVKFKKVTGKNPTQEDFRNHGDKELMIFWSTTVVFTLLWMIFGLLTSDWPIFLFIFIVNLVFNHTKKIFEKFEKVKYHLTSLKTLIGSLLITLLVINHFHLRLDLVKYLISFF